MPKMAKIKIPSHVERFTASLLIDRFAMLFPSLPNHIFKR
jgi:hypothetical protein